ncbi:hypothetical protein L0244_04155, partial [bacterium]|nr:hypothetical protein [bacterium]
MKKAVQYIIIFLLITSVVYAEDQFEKRLEKITGRTEFRHATFGIQFYSLESKKPLFSMNADKFFVPASTT